MDINHKHLLQMLLARALLDIRIAASEENYKVCYTLSDLFHNVPYQMNRVDAEYGDYLEVIEWLEARSTQMKISKWFDHALSECKKELTSKPHELNS